MATLPGCLAETITAPEPDRDDPPDREESSTQDIEATDAPQGGHKALLKAITQDLNLKDKTGPAIEGELAELMNALLKDNMTADALKTRLDQHLRHENVEGLRTPKVNPLIWNQISASMRTQDAGSQKNLSMLVVSTITMAKAADRVMKKYAEDSELLALVTDAIALAIQCHHEASHARRLAMKKELHKDYGSVCSTVVGTSEFLFGDLSKFTKDITDANRLTKKMRPPPPPPSHPDAQTCTGLTLTARMDPSLAGEKTGFISTSIMTLKIRIF